MTGTTERLAEFVVGLGRDNLPPAVAARAKALILDLVGIAVRARHDAESTESLISGAQRMGLDRGPCGVFGDPARYTMPAAALINGTLAHSLDFDDTHAAASLHTGAPIAPAAFAAAEACGASGRDALAGIVAGIEVQTRLGKALVPKAHYARGYHPTATCGAFGAAAAAARTMGLPADQVAHALGIALSQTSGSMAFLVDGAWTKRYQVGHAAMNGTIAASMAAAGFRGPAEPIVGKHGFLRSYAPDPEPALADAGLGETWETMAVAVKPYPSCRYSHAAMDAVIDIARSEAVAAEDVEAIEVGLPRTGWDLVGDPQADKQSPKSTVDGQFSMPFLAAVALREHGLVWDDYARHLADPVTLALCRKVRTRVDDAAEAEFPAHMSARVTLFTKRDRFERFVAVCKGEPENFLSDGELRAKFDGLTGPFLPSRRGDRIVELVRTLETVDDIGALLALTRTAAAAAA